MRGNLHGLAGLKPIAFLALGTLLTAVADVTAGPARDRWDVSGSFGVVDGPVVETGSGCSFTSATVRLDAKVERDANGVELRRSVLKNLSPDTIFARCLLDRFVYDGGEYEVYTQVNTWQQESRGLWQPLNTGVEVRGDGMRSSFGAAPMLAVWNAQAGRGRVFHLLTDSAWEMHARRIPVGGEKTKVVVEIGMDGRHLDFPVAKGGEVAFPEILTYEFSNRTDFDCHKLHAWWHARYPRRNAPAVYNSWLCRFCRFDADIMLRQVEVAKKIGLDYFVLDAGWFGPKADWWSTRGDWVERPDGMLDGRMAEISAAVRKAGMKFGFWVEAEAANADSAVYKAHPDWFVRRGRNVFLDFRKREAFDYLVDTVCGLLKRYEASYLKFDFNQDGEYDLSGKSFAEYNAGYRAFIREVRARNPGLYIDGCASGGLMMDLGWARDVDSIWLSDNQSPFHGLRIVKDTMVRLPPRAIERWIVARTESDGQPDYHGNRSRLVATDDATWTNVRSVGRDYLEAFIAGGTLGFSCDLTAFSADDLAWWKDVVDRYHRDDRFWSSAVGRILCDTPSLTAFEYSDAAFDEVRIVVAADRVRQDRTVLHPVLAPSCSYRIGDETRTSADIAERGIAVPIGNYAGREIRLLKAH